MFQIRRIYIFIVAGVSLNAVVWAVISLLRSLLVPRLSPAQGAVAFSVEAVAFQLAVIVIGLPIYLAHWLWAERLAAEDETERQAVLRRFYLVLMMTVFLLPLVANSYSLLQSALNLLLGVPINIPAWSSRLPDGANLINSGTALAVLALIWSYHAWVLRVDRRLFNSSELMMTIQRAYLYLFCGIGLVLGSIGAGNMLRWLFYQFGDTPVGIDRELLSGALAMLLVGAGLWLPFWRQAERRMAPADAAERLSVLRKFYLYLVIFLAALGVVGSLTVLLAGLFRRLLSLSSQGDSRDVISVLLVAAVVWIYHYLVLRQDTRLMPEAAAQANVRRLYWYLVAAIGLMALLIGIGGDISVLLRSGSVAIGISLRTQMAWFTAVLIAGLFVWIVPWQKIQSELLTPDLVGQAARQAMVRRLYLYFYLLLATLTFLAAGIYVVFQLLFLFLGGRSSVNLGTDLSQAVAYALLAIIVWLYHGKLIREDNAVLKLVGQEQAKSASVVIVDDADHFSEQLLPALQQELPLATVHAVELATPVAAGNGADGAEDGLDRLLREAQVIVGPWTMATPYVGPVGENKRLIEVISASPAHKLLLPTATPDWDWAGAGEWSVETAVKQTVTGIKQVIAGEPVTPLKRRSVAVVVMIVLAVLFLLTVVIPAILMASSFLFYGY